MFYKIKKRALKPAFFFSFKQLRFWEDLNKDRDKEE